MDLYGTYAGIVEAVKDPERLGRVKVRVPHVYGGTVKAGAIGTNELPWALPAGMPAGGTPASGGFSMLPEVGDKVWVRFLDGEPEKPIWEWANQTIGDVKNFSFHKYADENGAVGSPEATRWTRYSHAFEINPDAALATTKGGYRLVLTDGGTDQSGSALLSTAKGNFLLLDDSSDIAALNTNEDCYLNIGDSLISLARSYDFTATTDSFTFTAGEAFDVTAGTSSAISLGTSLDLTVGTTALLSAGTNMTLAAEAIMQANFATLRLGAGAAQPFVLGTQLVTFLTSLLSYLALHTHVSGTPGSPTSPPTVPIVAVQPLPSLLISQTIFGQ